MAAYDIGAAFRYGMEKMLKPLADKLVEFNGKVSYKSIKSNHSFMGQRMRLTKYVGEWIEETIKSGTNP